MDKRISFDFTIHMTVFLIFFLCGLFQTVGVLHLTGSRMLTNIITFVVYPAVVSYMWSYLTLGFITKHQEGIHDLSLKKRVKVLKNLEVLSATRKHVYVFFYAICFLSQAQFYFIN